MRSYPGPMKIVQKEETDDGTFCISAIVGTNFRHIDIILAAFAELHTSLYMVYLVSRDFDELCFLESQDHLFNIENPVLWARSEIIGSAIDQIYSWVSGVSVQPCSWLPKWPV